MKLNLGCGRDHRDGYVNVDLWPGDSPDIVADIRYPIPGLSAGCAEHVMCNHVLEHLHGQDWLKVMQQIAWLLRTDGTWEVRVPHPAHDDAMINGHVCVLTPRLWNDAATTGWFKEDTLANMLRISEVVEVANPACKHACQVSGISYEYMKNFFHNAFTETVVRGVRL